jgi:hypothetical protein
MVCFTFEISAYLSSNEGINFLDEFTFEANSHVMMMAKRT